MVRSSGFSPLPCGSPAGALAGFTHPLPPFLNLHGTHPWLTVCPLAAVQLANKRQRAKVCTLAAVRGSGVSHAREKKYATGQLLADKGSKQFCNAHAVHACLDLTIHLTLELANINQI